MALIKCPECGKEVSDKAAACPNCGLGIREYIEEENRRVLEKQQQETADIKQQEAESKARLERQKQVDNVKLPDKPSKGKSIFAGIMCTIMALIGWFGVFADLGFIWLIIAILFSITAIYSPKFYKDEVKKYEQAMNNPSEYKRSVVAENERKAAEAKELARKRIEDANKAPKCPKCGSTYISTVNRGYSVVWGFIGSGKAMNVCQKCGHKWKPGT